MIIDGLIITKGLIVDKPWIDLILSGRKIWEMRTTGTKFRGHFALIEKGTGMIVGLSELVGSLPSIKDDELMNYFDNHNVDYDNSPELSKWNTPWVLKGTRKIEPLPYTHKRGAVIWVNL